MATATYKPSQLNKVTRVYWTLSKALRGQLEYQIIMDEALAATCVALEYTDPSFRVHRKLVDIQNQLIYGN